MAFDAEQVERALRLTCSERSAADEGTILSWAKRVKLPEEVALEQLVVDNISSPAVTLHISTANKVGENQWKFHGLTSGNISPC